MLLCYPKSPPTSADDGIFRIPPASVREAYKSTVHPTLIRQVPQAAGWRRNGVELELGCGNLRK